MAYVLALLIPLADLLGAISTTQEKLPMPWNKFGRYVHPEHQRAREAFRERPWINAPSSELTPEQLERAVQDGDLPEGTKPHNLRRSTEDPGA